MGMKRICIPTGFSLVELLVVFALISIVSAFAVPTWQKYRANTDLKTAAREVMADISDAKQRAITANLDECKLTFDVAGNSYTLSKKDTPTSSVDTVWTKSLASYGSGIVLNSVSFGGTVVSFQSRGTVSNGNLTLRNGLGSTATITINITGRTYVEYTIP
jgi:prepilin-type N-terminal cleavage/methylation domain-containing protein